MSGTELQKAFSAFRAGNRAAFTLIYSDLKQPVFVICRRIVLCTEDAEDLTQNVFLKLFQQPPDAAVQNPRAWVFQLARNLAIDALRRQRPEHPEPEVVPFRPEHIDLRLDLEDAIASLPCRQREILTLHLNAELTFREISRIVAQPLPTVYSHYRKALTALRTLLIGGNI